MLTNSEKKVIKDFQKTKIPSSYKLDKTDNILYIEHVDFDLCNMLLKNKKVSNEYVQNEINEFTKFLTQLNVKNFDNEDKEYLNLLLEVINVFIKNSL